jgi:hypothetical protein
MVGEIMAIEAAVVCARADSAASKTAGRSANASRRVLGTVEGRFSIASRSRYGPVGNRIDSTERYG